MQKLWLFPSPRYLPVLKVQLTPGSCWIHVRKVPSSLDREGRSPLKALLTSHLTADIESPVKGGIFPSFSSQKLSLLEELFPEEVDSHNKNGIQGGSEDLRVPRLSLPDSNQEDELQSSCGAQSQNELVEISRAASKDAYRQWNLTVLVARRASKSLDESDFRRIAPKGHHIEDWKGPGDFLKVIPARDQSTLQLSGHYFLLFPNPAYARAYQGHIIALHRISRTYTPTSIESPISPPPGMVLEGEDIYSVLQNYSLCPPSQLISLKLIFPPYSSSMKQLLDQRGYSQITSSDDKTCNSILFWIDGYHPNHHEIHKMIRRDGQYRGLNWSLADNKKPIEKVGDSDPDTEEFQEISDTAIPQQGPSYPRHIISFTDENEARRFIRAWHRKESPFHGENDAVGEPLPMVHAEILW